MNESLLKEVRDRVRKDLLRLDLDSWVNIYDTVAPCQTTACIAGWTLILAMQKKKPIAWEKAAKRLDEITETLRGNVRIQMQATKLLGLTDNDAMRLFFHDNWPRSFLNKYVSLRHNFQSARNPEEEIKLRKQMSRLAARRITHFIKTGGD